MTLKDLKDFFRGVAVDDLWVEEFHPTFSAGELVWVECQSQWCRGWVLEVAPELDSFGGEWIFVSFDAPTGVRIDTWREVTRGIALRRNEAAITALRTEITA